MQEYVQEIEKLLAQLTLKEKVALCHGNSKFTTAGIPRLGIGELTMSDGPHGVREEICRDTWDPRGWENDYCTYLPTQTNLAATWNPELAGKFGQVLGAEARYRKKDIILGPGINIIRNPLCGRNFEYMSEDPCLISRMVVPLIQGIQETDTAACVKHYALNNQELDRRNVNVEVSKRALFEIYLKGFEAAVRDADVYSVMGAYNRYENQFCCHNKYLVCDILKGKWGFSGVFLSDWAGARDTQEAVENGLDIEMGTERPYHEYYLADAFEALAAKSPEVLELLNEKIRRILRLMLCVHKLDNTRREGAFNTQEHQKAAYEIAAESIILLKNNGILPIRQNTKKILVVGENATQKHAHGGNSSGVKALYEVTQLEGIQNKFADCSISYIKTTKPNYNEIPAEYLQISVLGAGTRAFRCLCYDNKDFAGEPCVMFRNAIAPEPGFAACRSEAVVVIPEEGTYSFLLTGGESAGLWVNDKPAAPLAGSGLEHARYYKKGEKVSLRVEFTGNTELKLEYLRKESDKSVSMDVLIQKAKEADYVIYCGGIDHNYDVEEFDRKDMKLPAVQDAEIPALLQANPNTVIVMTGGSPVEMPWVRETGAVLWCGYAGMEGGNALADILKGTVCPSGKLPYTLPVKLEDSPAIRYGEYQAENCKYNEGIYVGYRGFDKDQIEPLFCFGHGLSYAEFVYSDLVILPETDGIRVRFRIRNNSDRPAAETAQVYVGLDGKTVDCPVRELKAFQKVFLGPHQHEVVDILLKPDAFTVYRESTDSFEILSETCTVAVAASSRDIRLMQENIPICFV